MTATEFYSNFVDTQAALADPSPHPRHAAHTISHNPEDLPPDSKSRHRPTSPDHDPPKKPSTTTTTTTTAQPQAATSASSTKKQQHTLPLMQCYHACGKQVTQASNTKEGHAVLECLYKAHTKLVSFILFVCCFFSRFTNLFFFFFSRRAGNVLALRTPDCLPTISAHA